MHQLKACIKSELKEDGGIVKGYASTFDRDPDAYGDVVKRGAFAKSLEKWKALNAEGKFIPLLWGHDTEDPKSNIGRVVDAVEDERGLLITAEFDADNEKAQYVRKLVQEGRVYQFSFAFEIREQGTVELDDGRKANELRKIASAAAEIQEVVNGLLADDETPTEDGEEESEAAKAAEGETSQAEFVDAYKQAVKEWLGEPND